MSSSLHQPPAGAAGDHIDFRGSIFTGPVLGKGQPPAPPRSPAPWPHQVGTIPPTAGFFQHRSEAAGLHNELPRDQATFSAELDGAHGQVLTGMGGVGKTQLAAHHARTVWQTGQVDVLVWITASTSSAVVTGYTQAAVELLGADPAYPDSAVRAFLAWLEPKAHGTPARWLIVLDDVTDPNDMRGLWPPASPHGRTLTTTRRQDAALTGHGRRLIRVGLFTEAESLNYLTAALAAHDRRDPAEQLTGLAKDLGHLPLALSQAVAYLIDTGITVGDYRTLLSDRSRSLADAAPEALPDDQPHTMDAAWSLSVDRANSLRPAGLGRPLLQLAAFLDPNGIPESVLTSAPVLTHLTSALHDDTERQPAPVTAEQARLTLSALRRLSLVDHSPDPGHPTVRIHQLVQRAVRDTLTPDQHGQTARTAADALVAAWPEIDRDTVLAQALRANAAALISYAEQSLHQSSTHLVLYRAGRSLGEAGQVDAACAYFDRLTKTTTAYLGPDHPNAFGARSNLAHYRGEAGDARGAVTALAELLDSMQHTLGADHHYTLTTRSLLARWQGRAGDPAGAAATLREVLADRLQVLGPDHPDTLAARANLARWRGEAGDAEGAAAAFAELQHDVVRVLGPDHPDSLTTRAHLAQWRGEAGDTTGAATAYAGLLGSMVRVLGPDHPHTLATRNNLVFWRGMAGDAAGAAAAIAEHLHDVVRVLGPDHPDTLTTRDNLARWRGEAGDAAGAAAAIAELLNDMMRVLGPEHPRTLGSRNNLAYWRGMAGDAAGAVATLTVLVDDVRRALGPDHPHTLTVRGNLARWRGEAGDAAGAAAAFAELQHDVARVRGPNDSEYFNSWFSYAHWTGIADESNRAGS
ncbi:tetratricopeptide repeat protein [Streptomyces sp. NPDC053086]|uniref:tetratricopeptide repeat protein n=1 Tax=unclassified Streptomyces TaxID=2593676 RepID=UPI0037D6D262